MTEQHEHAYQRIGIHSGERDGREFVVEVRLCAVCKDRVEAEITRQARSEDERTNACQDISCDQPATGEVQYKRNRHRVCAKHYEAARRGEALTLTSDGKGGCIGYGVNVLQPVIPQTGDQERLAI